MSAWIAKGAMASFAISIGLIWAGCTERRATESTASAVGSAPEPAPVAFRIPFTPRGADFEVNARTFFARVGSKGDVQIRSNGISSLLPMHTTRVGALAIHGPLSMEKGVGLLSRTVGDVREEWIATSENLEARWAFASRPAGSDNLIVRLNVPTKGDVDTREDGLHFVHEHLKIGRGTWIDARGVRADVPIAFEAGEVRFTVPADVVSRSTFPAVLDPTISPEFEVKAAVTPGFALQASPQNSRVNRSVAAAFDGTNYLFAWYDDRSFSTTIMVARAKANGELIDKTGIPIAGVSLQPRFDHDDPLRSITVLSGPGGFLVAWRDTYTAIGQSSLTGVRIRSNGEIVDQPPLALGNLLDGNQIILPVVSLGDGFMALSFQVTTNDSARIDLVSIEGVESTKSPAFQTFASSGEGSINRPRLAAIGSDALVVYEDYGTIGTQKTMAFRANASGQVGAVFDLGLKANQLNGFVRVGNRLALEWWGETEAGFNDNVTLISADGQVGANALISGRMFAGDADGLVVLGDNGLCAYSNTLIELGCSSPGNFDDRANLALSSNQVFVLTPYNPYEPPWASQGPKARRYDRSSLAYLGDVRLAGAGNSQAKPAVAYDSTTNAYFGAWIDDHLASNDPATDGGIDGGMMIRGVPIRAQGATFGSGADIPLSTPGASSVSPPSMVFDGSQMVIVWAEIRGSNYQVMMSKVALSEAGGTLSAIAPAPVAIRSTSLAMRNPVIAADGAGYVIAWEEGSVSTGHISGIRVPKTASAVEIAALSPVFLSGPDQTSRRRGQVASVFDGKQTIVVWREQGGAATSIQGVTFPNGSNLPASAPFAVATGFSEKENLRFATDGKTGSLLVWADTVTLVRGIRAKFLSREPSSAGEPAVKPVDPRAGISLSNEIWDQGNPTVAFSNDRVSYLVTWTSRDKRGDSRLVGNYITLDGRVLWTPPFSVSDTTAAAVANTPNVDSIVPGENEDWAAAATGPESTVGLLYNRMDSRPGYGTVRARFRTVVSGKIFAAACTSNDECASRFCVSGVCCDSACNEGCGTCGGAGSSGVPSNAVKGTCTPFVPRTACANDARFVCDGTSSACPKTCTTDAQCAGGTCRDGQCTRGGAVCADELSVGTPSGQVSCGAYRCSEGTCFTRCTSVDECSPGNICSFEGRCEPAPKVEIGPEGCAIGTTRSRSSRALAGAALSMALTAMYRRRRDRRLKDSTPPRRAIDR